MLRDKRDSIRIFWIEQVQKGWFDKHNIGGQDIQIILKDFVYTVSKLYDKYMEKA